MKKWLKKQLLGYSLPQEFVCVDGLSFPNVLHVFLSTSGDNEIFDVGEQHLFLGYSPLVIGIKAIEGSPLQLKLEAEQLVHLSFMNGFPQVNTRWKGYPTSESSLGELIMVKKGTLNCGSWKVYLYEGEEAIHYFISGVHKMVNRIKEKRRADRKTNINLPKNLADQVQLAYSVPRLISLFTVFAAGKVNMFPTDLHGEVDDTYYVSSLRRGGKANEQVEFYKQIVLSDLLTEAFRTAYAYGKNHMKDLADISEFELNPIESEQLSFPLPRYASSYREMEVTEQFMDIGLHRIHVYQIINKREINPSSCLTHIHRFYAQWRLNNHQQSNYFWR